MNKEIKIIDLLNKIAKGEEVPKRIKLKGYDNIFTLREDCKGYKWYGDEITHDGFGETICQNLECVIKCEVEIIEEDNKIKKIQTIGSKWYSEYIEGYFDEEEKYSAYDEYLMNKINELIDEVNKLKEDNEN